ncbi:MAG: hypothetical protein WDN03_05445 [Rhizomicrobium sp.]
MPYPATEDRRVVPTQDARQGESTGHVRYVLYASMALAVIAGIILFSVYF